METKTKIVKPPSVFEILKKVQEVPQELFIPTLEWVNENRPLSKSSLTKFRKSPLHYLEYLSAPYEPTAAVILGKLIDLMVLRPQDVENEIFVLPQLNLRKAEDKAIKLRLLEENKGKQVVKQEDYDKALECAKSVYRNADAMYYLNQVTKVERRLTWTDPATGLKNIGYVDGQGNPEAEDYFFVEFKSTMDASKDGFIRQAHNFDYIMQIGGYSLGFKYNRFEFPDPIFISVETKAPYPVNVHRCGGKYLQEAQNEYLNTLLAFKYCLDNNEWHKSYDFFRFETKYHEMKTTGYFNPIFG